MILTSLLAPNHDCIATAYNGNLIHTKPSPKEKIGIGLNTADTRDTIQNKKAYLNQTILIHDQSEETKDLNKNIILINVSHMSAGLLSIKKIIGPKNQKKIIPFSKLPFEFRY